MVLICDKIVRIFSFTFKTKKGLSFLIFSICCLYMAEVFLNFYTISVYCYYNLPLFYPVKSFFFIGINCGNPRIQLSTACYKVFCFSLWSFFIVSCLNRIKKLPNIILCHKVTLSPFDHIIDKRSDIINAYSRYFHDISNSIVNVRKLS